MASAARIALDRAADRGELSFSSSNTIADRFSHFASFAKSEGVGRMERITPQLAQEYGQGLADQVAAGRMTPAYAQNMVSAINTVMHQVRDWRSVSPTKDCGIQQRSHVRDMPPQGIERGSQLAPALEALREAGQLRVAAVAELARELGLRSKEASMLDAVRALREAENRGAVTISQGTKGGRTREVPIASPTAREALQRAAEAQGSARAVMPPHQNWRQWRETGLRDAREILKQYGIDRLHDLRAAYACERYEQLTGHAAPVQGGQIQDRDADRHAREVISKELGHHRIEVVASYLGGR